MLQTLRVRDRSIPDKVNEMLVDNPCEVKRSSRCARILGELSAIRKLTGSPISVVGKSPSRSLTDSVQATPCFRQLPVNFRKALYPSRMHLQVVSDGWPFRACRCQTRWRGSASAQRVRRAGVRALRVHHGRRYEERDPRSWTAATIGNRSGQCLITSCRSKTPGGRNA
jgi:hypothetical protein